MEFESSIASHRATPVFVGIWIIRDLQNFSNYSKDVGFFSIFGGHWSPDQWEDPVNYIETRPSHAAYQVLYNFILAIHRGNPKQTPCSLADLPFFLSKRFKKPCFFRGANMYPPRKNAYKLNEWQAARLTSPFDFNFFRRWAFPPQNIYRSKDIFLRFNLFIKAV